MHHLISVLLPDGSEPTWEDAIVLNIGIGVIPELKVQFQEKWLNRGDEVMAPVVHMRIRFSQYQGRFLAQFVGLEAPEVAGTDLREIRVAELLRMASSAAIYVKHSVDEDPVSLYESRGDEAMSLEGSRLGLLAKERGPVDPVLKEVALIYNVALLSSQAPAKAVEKAFQLPARTAARWIAKARENGMLERPSLVGFEDSVKGYDEIRAKWGSYGPPLNADPLPPNFGADDGER
ncbi:hypothetical protein [Leucobacter aridicollis]|uniref:hypothetical protein n=1 Tax=Leucobacter aridicollis TaxID=283878 RepID=UPI0021066004|nr:hypothetical protein [Leucobacter aridicollis]UTX53394.1 hypothetical protein KI794_01110 [Leucobacter aridicollis]